MNSIRRIMMVVFVQFFFSVAQTNPCEDSLYLFLKSIPLDKMSERQYSYFMQKDKYCLESYTETTKKTLSEEVCTIEVRADKYEFEDSQDQFNPEIYVDDNRIGTPPQIVTVPSGQHTISLIPFSQINWEEGKVLKSKDRIAQLNSLVSKNVFHGNKSYIVDFKFLCNKGDDRKCDKNEWVYSSKILEKQ